MPLIPDRELYFRLAVECDIPDLIGLLHQLFSIEKDFQFDAEKQRAGLKMLLGSDRDRIFVAEKDGHVVGMCTLQIIISTAEGDYAGQIEDVIVDKSYRRMGIGSLLLDAAVEWAQFTGLKRLHLLADKNNQPALEFYHKHDWSPSALICLRKSLPFQ